MALKEVIPNGEAGEIAVLRAFRTKGRSLAPFGDAPRSLRSFGMTSNCCSLGTTEWCHPEASSVAEGSRPGGSQEPKTRSLLSSFVRDDRQRQNRGPSPSGMLPPLRLGAARSRSRCSGRQKNKSSGGQRVVILRPGVWPKDLGLEGVRTKGRSLAPFGDAPRSLRSFGTTSKGKIEVLRAKSFPQDDKPKQTQANPEWREARSWQCVFVC